MLALFSMSASLSACWKIIVHHLRPDNGGLVPTGRRCCRRQNLRSMEIKSDRLTDYDFCNNSYDFFIEEEMLTFTNSISNCSILIFFTLSLITRLIQKNLCKHCQI